MLKQTVSIALKIENNIEQSDINVKKTRKYWQIWKKTIYLMLQVISPASSLSSVLYIYI
jgi:hypothetical protein